MRQASESSAGSATQQHPIDGVMLQSPQQPQCYADLSKYR